MHIQKETSSRTWFTGTNSSAEGDMFAIAMAKPQEKNMSRKMDALAHW